MSPWRVRWASTTSSLQQWSRSLQAGDRIGATALRPAQDHWRDVSASMLQQAATGRFNPLEVSRGLSDSRRRMFFTPRDGTWQAGDRLRRLIRWEKFSLADSWPHLPPLDLVLMRNVMVYFDQSTRNEILTRVHQVMWPGGILLLGSAESMMLADHSFEPVTASGATYYVAKSHLAPPR